MISLNIEKFEELCREDIIMYMHDGDSIGTYNEKRLHRIFKRYVCDDANAYEVKIGKFVADIVAENEIIEIQTGSFRSLEGKIKYYLQNTDMTVRVLHPLICQKTIIRADKQSGEIASVRRSPKKASPLSAMANMFYLADVAKNPKFELCIAGVCVEEYRFSEAMRYRKKGRYDNDVRPTSLCSLCVLKSVEDYCALLPSELPNSFSAEEFSRLTHLRRRALYSVLNFYVKLGVLEIHPDNRKNIYCVVK